MEITSLKSRFRCSKVPKAGIFVSTLELDMKKDCGPLSFVRGKRTAKYPLPFIISDAWLKIKKGEAKASLEMGTRQGSFIIC